MPSGRYANLRYLAAAVRPLRQLLEPHRHKLASFRQNAALGRCLVRVKTRGPTPCLSYAAPGPFDLGRRASTNCVTATLLRLLIIEDSSDDAALVVRALTRAGYNVVSERVDTPDALVAALQSGAWHVAVADYTMPGFSGTAALTLLRQYDADLPFIFVSGTIGEEVAVAAMRTGAHD